MVVGLLFLDSESMAEELVIIDIHLHVVVKQID